MIKAPAYRVKIGDRVLSPFPAEQPHFHKVLGKDREPGLVILTLEGFPHPVSLSEDHRVTVDWKRILPTPTGAPQGTYAVMESDAGDRVYLGYPSEEDHHCDEMGCGMEHVLFRTCGES